MCIRDRIVPTPAGLAVKVTAVLVLFVTVAVNICVWFAVSVTLDGEILTRTCGISLTVAVLLAPPGPLAVMTTVCGDAMDAGAT